jgi:site-specific recombinase XerD
MADMKRRGLSVPTQKQRLAGLRMLFQALAREQIIAINPAAVVKGPKQSSNRGKTPVLSGEEMQQLLHSIDTEPLIGLRDRALIGAMAYSFARVGAVIALKVEDVFHQKRRLWLRLTEKGGKRLEIPCHHQFENDLVDWLERSGLKDQPLAPLFQSFGRQAGGGRQPSGRPLTQAMVWEMVQRRAKAAGLATAVCNHTFRATGITAYLSNGGTIERAAIIAGHASTRTTQLYDRRSDEVTLEEVEKIRF